MAKTQEESIHSGSVEERSPNHAAGMPILLLNLLLTLGSIALFIYSIVWAAESNGKAAAFIVMAISGLYGFIVGPILFSGLKVLKPKEAMVLTLFGKYIGTLKGEGFYFVNPFVSAFVPDAVKEQAASAHPAKAGASAGTADALAAAAAASKKKISLKAMTLNNERQKINDSQGNPIVIGIVVIWKVVNTYKAVFNVDNFTEYLSIQCDSALRNIVRLYPYDAPDDEGEKSLRGSSQEVALKLKDEIQQKADIAGIEIIEARITHLSYAPEIAAAMLQRQQASAIIAARQLIVEGAVGMVEMALSKLSENNIVELDDERKASMVSNLLVVLCGDRDAQPIVNAGSIY
jgi:regulator of protease activity HflC (stomatin/prohibitin superfamily)